jgi:membrane protein required for colicin V production
VAPIDLVLALVVLVMMVRGVMRGFVAEVLSAAAIVLGILTAVLLVGPAGQLVERVFGPSIWSGIIAFLVIFLATYLIVKLLEGLIQRGLEALNLHGLDRALGFLLGLAEGLLVALALLIILVLQPFFDPQTLVQDSLAARHLLPMVGVMSDALGLPDTVDV